MDLIEKKRTELDGAYGIRINHARNLFSDVIRALESIIYPGPPHRHYHMYNLVDIIKVIGEETDNASEKDVKNAITKVSELKENLENWRFNPESFYEQKPKETEESLKVCNGLKDLYTEEYQILQCAPESG
jgi:hypothetical protein